MGKFRNSALGAVTLSIGLGLATMSIAGKTLPLPEGTTVVAPDPSVPAEFANFVGIWNGKTPKGFDTTFVVTNMTAQGKATCIYAWDIGAEKGNTGAKDCSVSAGVLRVPYPYGKNNPANLAATLDQKKLGFTYFANSFSESWWMTRSK